jgi:NAD(P)-dependent dehydrogenase (short-subunit alcohol dehydrogenase family)
VKLVQIELEDLHQTESVAKQLASELQQLDGLILNAGLGVGPYSETKDGIDSHMQVNVFAQHQLAMMLLPKLLKTPDSRLVFQSSEFHRMLTSNPSFESLAEVNKDIGASPLYARSKLAQVLLMRYMHKLKSQGDNKFDLKAGQAPWINATHPGAVVTDQQEQAIEAYGTMGKLGVKAVRPFMKDPIDEGCRSALFAATGTEVGTQPIDGEYIVPDCKVADVSKEAKDDQLAERLWKLAETVLKDKIGTLDYPTVLI